MTKLLRNLADSVRTGIQSLFPRYRHFVALARLDRPIGIYLLLWPTLSALWLASAGWPGWHLLLVFTLGTGLARSAGCVMNDIADRNYDGLVKRTRNRPLASGDLKFSEAIIFMCVLCFLRTSSGIDYQSDDHRSGVCRGSGDHRLSIYETFFPSAPGYARYRFLSWHSHGIYSCDRRCITNDRLAVYR